MRSLRRHWRVLVAVAGISALLVGATACASATAASSSAPGSGSGTGSGSASAYFNCLREHGVTPGGFSAGSSGSGESGSSGTASAARAACASLRPAGGLGGFGGSGGSSGFSAALSKFESCLSAHGVKLPSSSSAQGGFRSIFGELQDGTSAEQAAFSACRSDLPFPGGGFGGGGYGGGSGSGTAGGSGGGTTT